MLLGGAAASQPLVEKDAYMASAPLGNVRTTGSAYCRSHIISDQSEAMQLSLTMQRAWQSCCVMLAP